MHACALSIEVHVPAAGSLKAKRSAIRPVLDQARARYHVAAAEVAYQDQWQRAGLAFAAVGGAASQVSDVLDKVERLVWSRSELVVLVAERVWLEDG